MNSKYDIVVVGGGHAGCEAALAASRLGMRTLLITLDLGAIGRMSCNPAIGGLAKGHLVREIDALGGEMARVIDETGIQFKMLNKSKGRAVWSPRAQADRAEYSKNMLIRLEQQKNLELLEDMVTGIGVNKRRLSYVSTEGRGLIKCGAAVLACGTFLNGLIHVGLKHFPAGRLGEPHVPLLTDNMTSIGFTTGRLKTGTPPRVYGPSIDFKKTAVQHGDDDPLPFSFQTSGFNPPNIPCYLTKTNSTTHQIIAAGLDRSPLYSGIIKGTGPRYCPSIEDKVVRFRERNSHQIFLEPEGLDTDEFYVNGFSTSLPEDVQERAIRTIHGMENVKIVKYGYAIEYDFFPPHQLRSSLETKLIDFLFLAGQINGTSGYEEAAAQGIIAGINAVKKLGGEDPLVLKRSEAYIGVLIDDLITKSTREPYRMFTSRAEYRLILRADNADLRLMDYGRDIGLIAHDVHRRMEQKRKLIEDTMRVFSERNLEPERVNPILESKGSSPIDYPSSVKKILKRPEISIEDLRDILLNKRDNRISELFQNREALEQVELEIKYEGYINRQREQIDRFKKFENFLIPEFLDYNEIKTLSRESREKLSEYRPESLGQASRISGVSPSDITVILITLRRMGLS